MSTKGYCLTAGKPHIGAHAKLKTCYDWREEPAWREQPAPGEPSRCPDMAEQINDVIDEFCDSLPVPAQTEGGEKPTCSCEEGGEHWCEPSSPPAQAADERTIIRTAIWLLENVEGAATAECYKKDSTDWAEWCAVRDEWLEVTNAYR